MLTLTDPILLLLAAAFMLLNGSNDGAALIAAGTGVRALPPGGAIAIWALAVAIVPAVVGTKVATTLADRLVAFGDEGGRAALAAAVATSILVVAVLIRLRLPTSITVALVGAIAGAGAGAGLPVDRAALSLVLALAVAAPLLGAVLAVGAMRLLRLRRPLAGGAARSLRRWHLAGSLAQAIAYGMNDAQKMFAVSAVLFVGTTDPVRVRPASAIAIALGFALGAVLGIRRQAATVTRGILALRPLQSIVAGLATAIAVCGTGLLGAPVSSTQTLLGGLVGAGASEGPRRVRWRVAGQLVVAWLVTMPCAFFVGAALGALVS